MGTCIIIKVLLAMSAEQKTCAQADLLTALSVSNTVKPAYVP